MGFVQQFRMKAMAIATMIAILDIVFVFEAIGYDVFEFTVVNG